MKMSIYTTLIMLTFFIQVSAQEMKVFSAQRAFFAGKNFSMTITGAANETSSFRLKYANRTLLARQFKFDKNGIKVLELNFPKLNSYVIAEAEITFSSQKGTVSEKLFFFPEKGITQGDSELTVIGEQALKDSLAKFGAKVLTVNDIERTQTQSLIVQGIDFNQYPGIEKSLEKLCEGKRKIVFIGAKGTLSWPNGVRAIKLLDESYPKQFDKRFDVLKAKNILFTSERDNLPVIKTIPGAKGLCFCQMKVGKGEIYILSDGVLENIKTNPSVLFFIKSLIGGK